MPSDEFLKYAFLAGLGLGTAVEYPTLSLAYRTLGRDAMTIWKLGTALRRVSNAKRDNVTMTGLFEEAVQRHPNKVRGQNNN